MRVATRRMRSTLSTFGRVLDAPGVEDLEQRLRELAAALGVVRDAEVLLERFDARLDSLPPELVLGPVRDRLHQSLAADRLQGRTALLATLSSSAYGRLLDDLTDLVASEPKAAGPRSRPAKDVLPKLVAHRYRKLARRASRAATATGSDRALALHQTRKSAKQLRYAAEAVEQAFGRPAAALAKQAEAIQEILGEHQDSVVASQRLKILSITANASEGESAFTYGVLVGLEQEAGNAARQEFDDDWKEASRKRYRRWLP
jgi:CHAD domain-containing protein